MMLHKDGSRHGGLGGRQALDLIVMMDDATSAILSAFSGRRGGHGVNLPGFARSVRAPRLALESLYRPRRALLLYRGCEGKADRAGLTQVGRALEHLGVEHIAAYSPQTRGRSERALVARAVSGVGGGGNSKHSNVPSSKSAGKGQSRPAKRARIAEQQGTPDLTLAQPASEP